MRFSNRLAVLFFGGGGLLLGTGVGCVGLWRHSNETMQFAAGIVAAGCFLSQAFMHVAPDKPVRVQIQDSPAQQAIPLEVEAETTAQAVRVVAELDEKLRTSRSSDSIPRLGPQKQPHR